MGSHYALYDPCGVDIHVPVVSGEERQDAGQIIDLPFPA
jgi:hypothetical protein